jgi:transposase-like protein
VTQDQVTTDGHGSCLRAIRCTLDRSVMHWTSAYKYNRLEQDHRERERPHKMYAGFQELPLC